MKALLIRLFAVTIVLAIPLSINCPKGHAEVTPTPNLTLQIETKKSRIYLGEKVSVVATLRNNRAAIRNIGYPRLLSHQVDFALSPEIEKNDASGVTLYRFAGEFPANDPGAIQIDPARLDCELSEPANGSEAFFGSAEFRKVTVESLPLRLTVIPLPVDSPPSFSGAIGTFTMDVVTNPEAVIAGEPLTVTTVIKGSGTLTRARCPELSGPGLRGYPVKENREADSLTCEQVIVPLGAEPLPEVSWSYFNPEEGGYQTERVVLPAPAKSEIKPANNPRESSSRQSSQHPYRILWWVIGFVVAGVFGFSTRVRKQKKIGPKAIKDMAPDSGQLQLSQLQQALSDSNVEEFYAEMFVALQAIIGKENRQNPVSVTSAPNCPRYATTEKSKEIMDLFESCVRIRYGRHVPSHERMKEDYDRLVRLIMSNIL